MAAASSSHQTDPGLGKLYESSSPVAAHTLAVLALELPYSVLRNSPSYRGQPAFS